MFRDYKKGDEILINSDMTSIKGCLHNKRYKIKTFENDNNILCIVLYLEYIKDHYAIMSSVSKDMKIKDLKMFKRQMVQEAEKVGAKTFLTFCNKRVYLDKWHKFLGFKKSRSFLSGKSKNMNKWTLVWE